MSLKTGRFNSATLSGPTAAYVIASGTNKRECLQKTAMTSHAVKLSVVIPCYNGAETIGQQLESLTQQEWNQPWEVVVADNGSTDNTRAIVEQFRSNLPVLRIIDASKRQGQPYALNTGVAAAAGEYIALTDADDTVQPGWVAALGRELEKYPLVGSRFDTAKLNPEWVQVARPNPQADGVQTYDYPPFLPHVAGSGLAFHAQLFEELQGFDESLPMLHDTDFCWRAQLAGYELGFAHEAVVCYRFRTSLRGMFKQSKSYARYNVILYTRYRNQGMPLLSLRTGLRNWIRLGRSLLHLRSKQEFARWFRRFGWQLGRLQASIEYRVIAL